MMNKNPQYWFCLHGDKEIPLIPIKIEPLEGAVGIILLFKCPECNRKVKFKIAVSDVEKIFGKPLEKIKYTV